MDITLSKAGAYLAAAFLGMLALGAALSSPIAGVLLLIAALLALPQGRQYLDEEFNVTLSKWAAVALVLVVAVAGMALVDTDEVGDDDLDDGDASEAAAAGDDGGDGSDDGQENGSDGGSSSDSESDGSSDGDGSGDSSGSDDSQQDDSTDDTPTATEASTPTATPEPTPAPDGESYSFSGTGGDATDSFATEGGLVVIHFSHDGDSNFQVQAISSDGDEEYLVNAIGDYDGRVALSLPADEYRLDVTADGSWTAEVTQPRFSAAEVEDIPASASGTHADYMGPFEFEGTTEVHVELQNDRQMAVWLTGVNGERVDLLFNEIGPAEDTVLVTQEGHGLLVIETDAGEWQVEIREG